MGWYTVSLFQVPKNSSFFLAETLDPVDPVVKSMYEEPF